jgi:hypothetical protein
VAAVRLLSRQVCVVCDVTVAKRLDSLFLWQFGPFPPDFRGYVGALATRTIGQYYHLYGPMALYTFDA